jgi:hypothetical protein
MADEMIAGAQLRREVVRLLFEVDPFERRLRRVAAPCVEDDIEPVGEGALRRPGHLGVPDTPVDEDESRHK